MFGAVMRVSVYSGIGSRYVPAERYITTVGEFITRYKIRNGFGPRLR